LCQNVRHEEEANIIKDCKRPKQSNQQVFEGMGLLMAKEFWETKNPKKKSKTLTPSQKASAKASAKKAGRPYPNLVDNAAASRRAK